MKYFRTVKYNDNLYQFADPLGVLATLVIGEEKALLLDTCYGIGNLKEEVRKITQKELIVINSHGHMDHSGGNYQFDEVLIHKDDYELLKKHNSLPWRERNIRNFKNLNLDYHINEIEYLNQREGNIKFLNYFDEFDLGNLKIKILPLPGHTKGSIAIYLQPMKLMLVSDGTCPFVWMFLEESTTVTEYINGLEKLLEYDFDKFLVGHGARILERPRMVSFLNIAKEIDLEKSVKVSFNNFDNLNSYCYTHDKMYDQNGCGIVFDPNKL